MASKPKRIIQRGIACPTFTLYKIGNSLFAISIKNIFYIRHKKLGFEAFLQVIEKSRQYAKVLQNMTFFDKEKWLAFLH